MPTANTPILSAREFLCVSRNSSSRICSPAANPHGRGQDSGAFVSGIVKDESGEVAARFTGRIEPEGSMTGTYTDRTGEVGSWRWPDSAESSPGE